MNDTLIDHPIKPLPSHPILKRLVKPDIHRLAERSASAWNVLHLLRPSGFPLKIRVDGSSVPPAVIVTATVTRFVSFVDVRMWMVFFSNDLISSF